jgi:hypothetical protein
MVMCADSRKETMAKKENGNDMRTMPKIICTAIIAMSICASTTADAQPATRYFTHTAMLGDTLIGLADRYLIEKKNWQSIQNENKIPNPRRIKPGTEIRIPIALMRSEPATAKVIAVQGPVETSVGALEKGAVLSEGAGIKTGENGFVTLQLADGSTIVVQSKSQVKLEVARVLANTGGVPSTTVGLTSGRVESSVEKRKNQGARFEISTPTSNMGVRGTRFRVSADESGKVSRGEVLEGVVAVASASLTPKPLDLGAGFGSVVEEGKAASAPVALLAAPDLSATPALQERIVLRFKFADVEGATGYRGQVATDSAFNNLLADEVFKTAEAKFANLDDGQYFFRARAIDKVALEGSDAVHAFKLKARPEPPFTSEPKNKNKLAAEKVEFKWANASEAGSYRFQLASRADFAQTISDERGVVGSAFSPTASIKPGDYFWRVASVRLDGDVGPFSDTQSFTLKAMPSAPNPPKEEGNRVGFSWGGEPGQTFDFQLASDAEFKTLVDEKKLTQPEITIEKPSDSGIYYMRYRSIDADGFVGPYSSAQTIEVKANRWWLLLLVVPFLL